MNYKIIVQDRALSITEFLAALSEAREAAENALAAAAVANGGELSDAQRLALAGSLIGISEAEGNPLEAVNIVEIDKANEATAIAGENDEEYMTPLATKQAITAQAGIASYTDITGSRAVNTTYTNTTGRVLDVAIIVSYTAADTDCNLSIGAVPVQRFAAGNTLNNLVFSFTARVPPGAAYALNRTAGNTTLTSWLEGAV